MGNLLEIVGSAWPLDLWRDVHVVVAVSGGPDSMALLRAILEIKGRSGGRGAVLAAHVHHGLHPAADEDEAWLLRQTDELGVPLTVERVDTREAAACQGDGLEAAARSLRYAALKSTAEHVGARYVATGHTADDQVETVLHRILRGTGIEGLAGIPRERPLGTTTTLVRPMLSVSRDEVLRYLDELGQTCREDPTNIETKFTRNRIRRELLPLLRQEYNSQIDEAVRRLARQAAELGSVLRASVDELLQASAEVSMERIVVDAAPLQKEPEPLIRGVLRAAWRSAGWPEQAMTDANWRRLAAMLCEGPHEPIKLPGRIDARREDDRLVLASM